MVYQTSPPEYAAQPGAGTPGESVAPAFVPRVFTQDELTVNGAAEQGSSFAGPLGGDVAQISPF